MNVKERNLRIIEQELRFIARHSQAIEGAGSSDFEAVDEICLAVRAALGALEEYRARLLPEVEAESDEIRQAT